MGYGYEVTSDDLADIMIKLQKDKCHNINLVSPTHVVSQILEALKIIVEKGLNIPLVYNSGCYDSYKTIQLLDNIIDIYMPDMKYGNNHIGQHFLELKTIGTILRKLLNLCISKLVIY